MHLLDCWIDGKILTWIDGQRVVLNGVFKDWWFGIGSTKRNNSWYGYVNVIGRNLGSRRFIVTKHIIKITHSRIIYRVKDYIKEKTITQ